MAVKVSFYLPAWQWFKPKTITFPLMSRGSGQNNKIKYYRDDGGRTKKRIRLNKVVAQQSWVLLIELKRVKNTWLLRSNQMTGQPC